MADGEFFPSNMERLEHRIDSLSKEVAKMGLDFSKVNAAQAALDAEIAKVAADIKSALAQIAALKAQIGTANPADQAALDALAATLQNSINVLTAGDTITP